MGLFKSVMLALGLTVTGIAGCADSTNLPPTLPGNTRIYGPADAERDERRDAGQQSDNGHDSGFYDAEKSFDVYTATETEYDASQTDDVRILQDAAQTDARRIEDALIGMPDVLPDSGADAYRQPDSGYADAGNAACLLGERRSFYTGPDGTPGVGNCRAGLEACLIQDGAPAWVGVDLDVVPAPERCNYEDDDCDHETDEGVRHMFYRDEDRDGHGTELDAIPGCEQPDGYVGRAGDCDDRNNQVNPDAPELCNQRDDNCEGAQDEGCECAVPEVRACGDPIEGECREGVQICDLNGSWSECFGYRGPEPERCDGKDNSCDGQTDEGYELGVECLVGIGACERSGLTMCAPDGLATICSARPGQPQPEKCDGTDANCDGVQNEGYDVGVACEVGVGACRVEGVKVCAPSGIETRCDALIIQPQPDICGDGIDQDCDGEIDNDRLADCRVCDEPGGVTVCYESIEYCSTQFNVRNAGFEKRPVGDEVIPCWESSESQPQPVRAADHHGPICEGEYVVRKLEGDRNLYTLTQRIVVADRAQRIDAHQQNIELSAQVVSANDYARLGFRFYDTEGVLLGEQFEEFRNDGEGCQNKTYQTRIPERTRQVDIVLIGENNAGNTNNATFDDVRISVME